jgi:hypothetical protein
MHDKTDQLIASLASDTATKAPLALHTICLRWIVGFVLYAAVLVAITGVREDFAIMVTNPWAVAELIVLLVLVMSAAFCAVLAAYPDRHQRGGIMFVPAFLLLIFFAVLAAEWTQAPPEVFPTGHGPECLSCISIYALLPGAWLLYQLRKLASIRPSTAGALALLATFSLGAFVLRLKEATDYMPHLLMWHYLPMFVAAFIGVLIGRWILKW